MKVLLSLATVIMLYAGGFIGAMIDRRSRTRETDIVEYQA